MATIVQIDGVGKVELDDSFKSLSPAQQQSTVDEIANHHAAPSAATPAVPAPEGAAPADYAKATDLNYKDDTGNIQTKTWLSQHPDQAGSLSHVASSAIEGFKNAYGDDPSAAPIPDWISKYVPPAIPVAAAYQLGNMGLRALGAAPGLLQGAVKGQAEVMGFDPTQAYQAGQTAGGMPEALAGVAHTLPPVVRNPVMPAVAPTVALVSKAPEVIRTVGTKLADVLAGPGVSNAEKALAALKPEVSNQASMLEAGQTATGVAPTLARPINDAAAMALKEEAAPLFEEAFKPTSTAPLKDQYENANNAAGAALKKAQDEVANAENAHTQLLAKANDQTSVYGVNPGQISQSENAIEDANKSLELAQAQKNQVLQDLRGVQEDILSGKQGAAYTPQISILLKNPKVKQGISRGIAVMRDEADAKGVPLNLTDLGVKIDRAGDPILDANGDVQVIGVPKTRLLHIAKIGLNDIYNGYKDSVTGLIKKDSIGAAKAVNGLADSLVTELRNVNPSYNSAMDLSQKYLSSQKGFTKGATSIFNDRIDEATFARMMKNMTPEEKAALPEGVSNYTYELTRKLPSEAPAGAAPNPALPQPKTLMPTGTISQRSQGKLAMVLGDEKANNFVESMRNIRSNPSRVSDANKELADALAARKKTLRTAAGVGAGLAGAGVVGKHFIPYILP